MARSGAGTAPRALWCGLLVAALAVGSPALAAPPRALPLPVPSFAPLPVVPLFAPHSLPSNVWLVTVPYSDDPSETCTLHAACSFQGALRAATGGDVVKVMVDVTLPAEIHLSPVSGVIRVEGAGHAVRTTASGNRALVFDDWKSGSRLVISDLTFTGFRSTGSMVCIAGDESCDNEGKAKGEAGGAAVGKAVKSDDPSVASQQASNLALVGCTFINNTAEIGVVEAWGHRELKLEITDCTFTYNNVTEGEGGYQGYIVFSRITANITYSLFEGNSVGEALLGGGDSHYSLSLSQVKVGENRVTNRDGWTINSPGSSLTVSYTTFAGNTVPNGINCYELKMWGSIFRAMTDNNLVAASHLMLAETSISGATETSIDVSGTWNRNPGNANITQTSAFKGCGSQMPAGFGCNPAFPCKDLYSEASGLVAGYECVPEA